MRILIFLLFLPFLGLSQTINYQGNVNSISGFRGGLLVDLDVYFPQLRTIGTDTALSAFDSTTRGKSFRVTKSTIQRWAAINSNLTFQQVLNNGATFNKDNEVNFSSFKLRLYGGKTEMDSAQIGYVDLISKSRYTSDVGPFSGNELITASGVEDLITQTSWDSTMSETVTELTSTRFTKPVSTVNYAGMSFNSDYFSQNLLTGTITFIGLTFYNGQKLTFNR